MRSNSSSSPARRNRRRGAAVATVAAFGLIATAGFAAATPTSQAEASGAFGHYALASFTTTIEPVATVTADGSDEIATDVRDALADADATLTATTTIEKNVEKSGLKIRKVDTDIDTDDLEAAVDRLEAARSLPAPLVPDLTDDVTSLITSVDGHVGDLKKALDKAEKLQVKKEAAAKAKREAAKAAKAAAAAAAAAQTQTSSAPAPAPASSSGGNNSPAAAQATARSMGASKYGWGDGEFSCLVSLWNKESGWNYQAHNASSGAHGIPQALPGSKMASAGSDWQTNAATQVAWGLGYISGRYGSPCGAWSHSQSVGWY